MSSCSENSICGVKGKELGMNQEALLRHFLCVCAGHHPIIDNYHSTNGKFPSIKSFASESDGFVHKSLIDGEHEAIFTPGPEHKPALAR